MLGIGVWTIVFSLYFISIPTVLSVGCWARNACIDVRMCNIKGGSSQAGLCPGGQSIQCCSCLSCMDASRCVAKGGVPYAGICPGGANIQCCNRRSTSYRSSSGAPPNNNMMLTNLADILRDAGLDVEEEEGWKTRGHGGMMSVKGILIHHTAGPSIGDFPSLATVRDGRPDLSGPLAQLGLGRTGKWYVIAAGRAYHAGKTIDNSLFGNFNAISIEAEGIGVPEDELGHKYWPEVQWQSYIQGVRALQAAYDVSTERILGHKEAAVPLGRKSDPNFSMDEFREALG